jgi:methionyl-tRNA formyltransferase
MGTPALAAKCLLGLHQAGYEIPLVVTQPDRPKGRGRKLAFSPVKELALNLGLEIYQPEKLKHEAAIEMLRQYKPDLIVVAAFGQILPKAVLDLPPLGCINVHASLLPAYRGAAPIQWALLDGLSETGVTIMLMEEGLDTGPMLLQKSIAINKTMTGEQLYNALAELGTVALLESIPLWAAGKLTPIPQQAELASYAVRIERQHERIDWQLTAASLDRQIRTFYPWPGASTQWQDKEVKLLQAELLSAEASAAYLQGWQANHPDETWLPGMVLSLIRNQGIVVQTGEGALLVTRVQPVGKQPMDGASFVNGYRLSVGDKFQ